MSAVLVLNASYEPLQRVSVKHALTMLHRQVAVVEEVHASGRGIGLIPRVVRLVKYVTMAWIYRRDPSCTKAGVRARDGRCGYCTTGRAETVDHIIPASRGGGLTWTNTVAACKRCNNRKADRTPEEARMPLLIKPYVPTRTLRV